MRLRFWRRRPKPVQWERNVITFRITDPIFYDAPNGDRVQVLPDGSEFRYTPGRRG